MNNRNNNNRRRGRGNNNNNRQNGGQQINRIDSRARGNAPQMLEKYRKMALDSHMNGDRVNEEYYLQFADHYFRVIADTRVRQEESRQRRDERWQDGGEGGFEREYGDYGADDAGDMYDDVRQADARDARDARAQQEPRQDRYERQDRNERADANDRSQRGGAASVPESGGERAEEAPEVAPPSVYEPSENPFVRSESRGLRQRRQRGARDDAAPVRESGLQTDIGQSDTDGADAEEVRSNAGVSPVGVFDPTVLPPAVSSRRSAATADAHLEAEPQAEVGEDVRPRRRTRRPRAVPEGGDEALQAAT